MTQPILRPVNRPKGNNKYCVPAAMSVLTGDTTSNCATVIRRYTGQQRIRRTSLYAATLALQQYGVQTRVVHDFRPTLIGVCRMPGVFIISYEFSKGSWHAAVVGNGKYICGLSDGIVDVESLTFEYRTDAPVRAVYKVLTGPDGSVPEVIKQQLDGKRAASRARSSGAKVRALAKQHGIRVEQNEPGDSIWVYPPDDKYQNEEDDPYWDSHYCDTWDEAMERVEKYIAGA